MQTTCVTKTPNRAAGRLASSGAIGLKTSIFLLSSVAALALGIVFGLAISQTAVAHKPSIDTPYSRPTPPDSSNAMSDSILDPSVDRPTKPGATIGWPSVTTRLAAAHATPM